MIEVIHKEIPIDRIKRHLKIIFNQYTLDDFT